MNARNRQTLAIWFVAALACLILAFAAVDAHAETFDAHAAQVAYDQFDVACGKGDRKACDSPEWRKVGVALSYAGWLAFPDHVWIRASDLQKTNGYLQTVDNAARADLGGTYNSRFAVISQFQKVLPGAALSVWWRVNRQTVREAYPAAWAVLSDAFDASMWQYEHTPHYHTDY